MLINKAKSFLIIGNQNAITYKEIFPLIKDNKIWLGCNMVKEFVKPDKTTQSFGNVGWFTNIPHKKRNTPLTLYKKYNAKDYPKYDNYDVIEVSKTVEIPKDYDGIMGVPITFLDKYCPEQFEIAGIANNIRYIGDLECYTIINSKPVYNRVLIKNKKPEKKEE